MYKAKERPEKAKIASPNAEVSAVKEQKRGATEKLPGGLTLISVCRCNRASSKSAAIKYNKLRSSK
jgi:hypothetical protein